MKFFSHLMMVCLTFGILSLVFVYRNEMGGALVCLIGYIITLILDALVRDLKDKD